MIAFAKRNPFVTAAFVIAVAITWAPAIWRLFQ